MRAGLADVVALAKDLGVKLVTTDEGILADFANEIYPPAWLHSSG